jgi:hypothetical protein
MLGGSTYAATAAAGAGAAAGSSAALALAAANAGVFSTLGTAASIGGSVLGGIQGMNAANAQAAAIKSQAATEAKLTAATDTRQRAQFASNLAQQRAELAARGVTLDSPTAIALGMTAAKELSFQSQATRSEGAARAIELTASQRYAKAQGFQSLLKGGTSAAGTLLEKKPDLWPGLYN